MSSGASREALRAAQREALTAAAARTGVEMRVGVEMRAVCAS